MRRAARTPRAWRHWLCDARAVRAGDIEDLVDEFGVTYFECSAKDGDGVEELFAEAAQQIFDSPESWST